MSYTLTIGGTEYGVLVDTLSITDNINDRSTCSFDIQTSNTISIGQEVIIEHNGIRIFGGKIKQIKKYLASHILRLNIACVDFNSIGDQKIVGAVYENANVFQIYNEIVDGYLSAEGVTTGTMVSDTTVSKAVFNYKYVNDCFSSIKNTTQVNYNIDYSKVFTSFYRSENIGTAITESAILECAVETNQLDYRNSQYLRAGQDTTDLLDNQIPTPRPDGKSRTFFTRFPIAKQPVIRINGTTVSETDIGINRTEEEKKWYWNKGDNFIVQDTNETVLTDSDELEMDYYGLVKIVVSTQDGTKIAERQAIEGGTGIYEAIEDQASIDDRTAAQNYSNGLIEKYDIPEIVTLRTQEFRTAGEIINIQDSLLEINDDYLIESVGITEENNDLYYEMRCLSGESFGSWVEFFRSLRKDSTDMIINQNEVLVLLGQFTEDIELFSETDIEIYDALYPSNTLYPSLTLTPGSTTSSETISDS
jgi:hypothetical protein